MGVHSARGMGPAFTVRKVFQGSAARANVQAEIGRMIVDLNPDQKELFRRAIAQEWRKGGTPQQVYDFAFQAMEAFRAKDAERRG